MTPRQRLIFARVLPTTLFVALMVQIVHGSDSIFNFWELERAADSRRADWAAQERENTELLLQLRNLERDPINFERLAAEELGWAGEGATLYYFDDNGSITER